MNNLLSYCGLVDAKRASDKDLPVLSALVVRPDGHNKAEHPELHIEQLLFYIAISNSLLVQKKKEFENQADETNLFGSNRSPMLVEACQNSIRSFGLHSVHHFDE